MKKYLPLLCLLLALLLSACGNMETKTDSSDEIHPHAFTAPYLFAHCCIGCFYLATPRCLMGERPKGKRNKKH